MPMGVNEGIERLDDAAGLVGSVAHPKAIAFALDATWQRFTCRLAVGEITRIHQQHRHTVIHAADQRGCPLCAAVVCQHRQHMESGG